MTQPVERQKRPKRPYVLNLLFLFLCVFSLSRLSARELGAASHKTIILTIPKSGTHLIDTIAKMISGKPVMEIGIESINFNKIDFHTNSIDIYHLWPPFLNMQQTLLKKAKIVIMIRDPRDVIISRIHWIEKHKLKTAIDTYNFSYEEFKNFDFQTKVKAVILSEFDKETDFSKQAIAWMQSPYVHVCSFEDLVGPKGGGDRNRQIAAIQELALFMGFNLPKHRIEFIADNVFGVNKVMTGDGTFRSGQIGSWKNCFGYEEKALYKELYGRDLIEMGYEQDYAW